MNIKSDMELQILVIGEEETLQIRWLVSCRCTGWKKYFGCWELRWGPWENVQKTIPINQGTGSDFTVEFEEGNKQGITMGELTSFANPPTNYADPACLRCIGKGLTHTCSVSISRNKLYEWIGLIDSWDLIENIPRVQDEMEELLNETNRMNPDG